MADLPSIERFESSNGVRIYRIPVEAFPGNFIAFCYILLNAGEPTLIDSGSGFANSNDDLVKGINTLQTDFGESLSLSDIHRILITHGHIDHFGGAGFMQEKTGARHIGIHPLDRRILIAYEERVAIATKDLRVYLERAGVKESLRQTLIEMYGIAKKQFRSLPVDISLEEGLELDGMRFYHAPGHCPGQVCIQIGDVLLSADHILARTTPHQAPESITHFTGLGHYLDALHHIAQIPDIRLTLGGHEEPIHDVYTRIGEIRASHERKLGRVLDAIREAGEPVTINDISRHMYPDKHGYEVLLALEEAGAHVEYLYEHGQLAVCNLDEVEREDNPPLKYGLA